MYIAFTIIDTLLIILINHFLFSMSIPEDSIIFILPNILKMLSGEISNKDISITIGISDPFNWEYKLDNNELGEMILKNVYY